MNFNKRQNAYSDIPGFDASKGECIVKALQKLLEKIRYLEQSRASEKSKIEPSHSSKGEDLTLSEVQYRLLHLQIQHVVALFKKKYIQNSDVFTAEISEDNQKNKFPKIDRNVTRKTVPQDIARESHSAEIPSASNSVGLDLAIKSENRPESVQSSAASHSVVANVQNIIAMMKSHNKALCGPKPSASRPTTANIHSTDIPDKREISGETSHDVTKLLHELSRDLCALAAKQQKLVERFDATQIKKHNPDVNLSSSNQNVRNKISDKHMENNSKAHRSYSESEIKLHAEVKKMPKVKEKGFVKYSVHPKQSAYNVRPQTSNLSIIDRRKLLRSLQNFKKHLSAEDISWD